MGDQNISQFTDEKALREFTFDLLRDVRALDYMLQNGLIEKGASRIGAEQELFLVDKAWRPANLAVPALERIQEERYTSELTQFNLEFNLNPKEFKGSCLQEMEQEIVELLDLGRVVMDELDGKLVMIGILPTIRLGDLTLQNLTPMPRYHALNDILYQMRGGPFEFQIRGADELLIKHETVMLEGCNTSFQCHFQVDPDRFPAVYNIAQALAGPVMAAATNSPLLLGKRLWHETRIALFQQSIDTRSSHQYLREMSPRVHFGNDWIHESVLEIYKDDIARFRILMTADEIPDPFEQLEKGEAPKLRALQLHNGTVYRWNRACYGTYKGKPHLRIENRILPSGPTPIDEMANAAFWFGLVEALSQQNEDVTKKLTFDDAKNNFYKAARLGLEAEFVWYNGKHISADELIQHELIPIAREGLKSKKITTADIDRYLGVMSERVKSKQSGSMWIFNSLKKMEGATRTTKLNAIVAGTIKRQETNKPVHTWDLASAGESGESKANYSRVEDYMSTDLITVGEDELIDLVASMMVWRKIRHVIVEDNAHQLVGLVSHRSILKYVINNPERDIKAPVPVRDIMTKKPISVNPETPTLEAIDIMRKNKFSALPVERDSAVIGIITEVDFMKIAGGLLEQILKD